MKWHRDCFVLARRIDSTALVKVLKVKTTRIFATAAAITGLFAASAAQAAFVWVDTLSPTNSTSTSISTYNDFRTQLAGQGVTRMYLGRSLGVAGTVGSFVIDIDFFASEAGYHNQFLVGNDVAINNQGNKSWLNRDAGLFEPTATGRLNFSFCAVTINDCHTNYQNDSTGNNSLQSIGMWLSSDRNTAWLLWDDSGAQADDNHDDLIVRLTYRSVPEPGTLALLGLGLVGVAMFRRRKAANI